jgi:YD repeat-containing protein
MLGRSLSFRNSFGVRTQFYCDTSGRSNVRFWPTSILPLAVLNVRY